MTIAINSATGKLGGGILQAILENYDNAITDPTEET